MKKSILLRTCHIPGTENVSTEILFIDLDHEKKCKTFRSLQILFLKTFKLDTELMDTSRSIKVSALATWHADF